MPLFMDLHELPGILEEDLAKAHLADIAISDQFGVTCRTYWLNKETGALNCLIEAPNPERANAMHKAAHGILWKEMIEVNEAVVEAFLGRIEETAAAIDPATTHADSALRIILFTDIVGSTKMTQELGDTAAVVILNAHDIIVRSALEKHGGREVKHTGDGIMASFASVAGAVNGAIEIQRGISDYKQTDTDHKLQVKIGLSAGEPVEKDQDLFGTTVQLAARICDHANADQILVAHTVQDLSAGKNFEFGIQEEVLLKGFNEPTKIGSVIWQQ